MRTQNRKRSAPRAQARRRTDDGNAFFPDPGDGPARAPDDLAEELAEEFLSSALSGKDSGEARDGVVPEENGGPFVRTSADAEFADGSDEANPPDAEREAFPNVGSGPPPPNRH